MDGSAPLGKGASPWPYLGDGGDEASLPGWMPGRRAQILPGPLSSWWLWTRVAPSTHRAGAPASPMVSAPRPQETRQPGGSPPASDLLLCNSHVEISWSGTWLPSVPHFWHVGVGLCFKLGTSVL